jgi:hypothetical protein
MRLSYSKINKQLLKTSKAIIAIGDSFVSGQGSIEDEIYENYKWRYPGPGYPLIIDEEMSVKLELIKKFNNLSLRNDQQVHFVEMESSNSFVNILCEKYFENEYVPINFGNSGSGNRGRIKELYLHPMIHWEKIKELIVVFMPTSIERFDFISDTVSIWNDNNFKTVWPKFANDDQQNDMGKLWNIYGKTVYSEKFGVMEQLCAVQELMNYCKLKNAKLIITPGFDNRYNKKDFFHNLSRIVHRAPEWGFLEESTKEVDNRAIQLINLWPWDLMFRPMGFPTMAALCMNQEPDLENKEDYFFQFQNKRSKLGWMTPCSHPGKKGHDLYAKLLFDHIKNL